VGASRRNARGRERREIRISQRAETENGDGGGRERDKYEVASWRRGRTGGVGSKRSEGREGPGSTHSTWREMEERKIVIIAKQQKTRAMKEKAGEETRTSTVTPCHHFHPIHVPMFRSLILFHPIPGEKGHYATPLSHERLALLTVPRRDPGSVMV
jgi:hypothetical protein